MLGLRNKKNIRTAFPPARTTGSGLEWQAHPSPCRAHPYTSAHMHLHTCSGIFANSTSKDGLKVGTTPKVHRGETDEQLEDDLRINN